MDVNIHSKFNEEKVDVVNNHFKDNLVNFQKKVKEIENNVLQEIKNKYREQLNSNEMIKKEFADKDDILSDLNKKIHNVKEYLILELKEKYDDMNDVCKKLSNDINLVDNKYNVKTDEISNINDVQNRKLIDMIKSEVELRVKSNHDIKYLTETYYKNLSEEIQLFGREMSNTTSELGKSINYNA